MENRNQKVDFYKGLLMWGVIWGHTISALTNGTLNKGIFIHNFFRLYDMPFFMILSGFFLFKSLEKNNTCRETAENLLEKLQSILQPRMLTRRNGHGMGMRRQELVTESSLEM